MKILITGTSGFVGKKLAKSSEDLDHEVIGIDFKKDKKYTTLNLDISSQDFLNNFNIKGIEIIFHLAAQSGGYKSLEDPYIDSLWNCVGTANMISLAKKLNIKKFIFISSMAIYGNGKRVTENTIPKPISFYGVSKLSGELQTKLLFEHNKINFTIFRLFATYGSGQDLENKHQGILSIYLSQILNSDEIKITGSKSRRRELVHINDVIDALIMGLKKETNNKTYNVTNNEKITPEIIINEISRQLNKKVKIVELDGYEGDQTLITSEKSALSKLGWEPSFNLNLGVKEFITNI